MKKNLSYVELDTLNTHTGKNEFAEDKTDCCFGGGNPLWLIDRGEITKDQDFYERRL